ncbi:ABC transporter permease [Halobacteriales archaeon QS_8_69_26]|nr:MAG: ABC transporter permease [Halobacteriales archaeon QS_8_69_26]
MKWYIARRTIWAIIVLWITLSVTWMLLELSPNQGELQAAQQAAMQGQDADKAIEDYKKREGLDKPAHERYLSYMVNMYTLNWGYSTEWDKNVISLFLDRWPFTLQYILPSTMLTMLVGYGLGLYSALNQYDRSDYVATFIAFFGLSIPNFWFAIVLVLITAVWFSDLVLFGVDMSMFQLPVFYKSEVINTSETITIMGIELVRGGWFTFDNVKQLLLPVIVISTAGFAANMRYARAYTLEYANAEFVKTARAKGANSIAVTRHILRVALVPLSTILVFQLLSVFATGTVVIEFIFSIPGLGQVTYLSFVNQDTPVILGITVIGVFVALFGFLLQDIAYVYLDPRIDYGDRTGGAG